MDASTPGPVVHGGPDPPAQLWGIGDAASQRIQSPSCRTRPRGQVFAKGAGDVSVRTQISSECEPNG
jgi:hypothetical protein